MLSVTRVLVMISSRSSASRHPEASARKAARASCDSESKAAVISSLMTKRVLLYSSASLMACWTAQTESSVCLPAIPPTWQARMGGSLDRKPKHESFRKNPWQPSARGRLVAAPLGCSEPRSWAKRLHGWTTMMEAPDVDPKALY